MTTWVLVAVLYYGGTGNHTVSIPGYQTLEECEAAISAVQEKMREELAFRRLVVATRGFCLQGPKREPHEGL